MKKKTMLGLALASTFGFAGSASAAVDGALLTAASIEILADIALLLAWAFPLVIAALVAAKALGLTKRFGNKV